MFEIPVMTGVEIHENGHDVAQAELTLALALAADELFWKSMQNTIYYVVGVVPAGLILSLLLALAMNQKAAGGIVFLPALSFFLPYHHFLSVGDFAHVVV
ncbi:MAG: hypothetical protein HC822_23415, partial [Oscillochloris sp.]|nr:hypothetical protein [Oscillochloris sp.]